MVNGLEYFPYIAAGAGALAGGALELVAQHKLATRRQAAVEQLGDIVSGSRSGKFRRMGRVLTSSLVFAGATAGYLNGQAWSVNEAAVEVDPALEVVVDYSGPVASGKDPAKKSIDTIVTSVAASELESRALVAWSGKVIDMKTAEVMAVKPFGEAFLDTAVQRSMDNAIRRRAEAAAESNRSSVGIVAITNGNPLGDPGSIIRRAQDVGTPISVINVESSVQDPAVKDQLQTIAKETKGTYWNIDTAEGKQVAEKVAEDLVSEQGKPRRQNGSVAEKVIGGLSALVLGPVYRNRRTETVIGGIKIKERRK